MGTFFNVEIFCLFQPSRFGGLVLEGEGEEETILETGPDHNFLSGKHVHHLTVRDVQFRIDRPLARYL